MTEGEGPIYESSGVGKTGDYDEGLEGTRTVVYPFGSYEILVKLTSDDRFLEVVEVRVNKDFRSYNQRLSSTGHHNAEEFYDK